MRRFVAVVATALVLGASMPLGVRAAPLPGEVAAKYSFTYVDSLGDRHVAGIVLNTTPFPAEFVKVTVRYYDSADALLLEDWGYTVFDVINPSGNISPIGSPFDIGSTVPPGFSRYSLSVDWRIAAGPANEYFHLGTSGNRFVVINDNTTLARFVKVVQVCYSHASGMLQVASTGWTYVDSNATSDIQPGQSAPFRIYEQPETTVPTNCALAFQSSSPPSLPTTMAVEPIETIFGSPVSVTGTATPGDAVTPQTHVGYTWTDVGAPVTAGPDGSYRMDVPLTFIGLIRVSTPHGPSVPVLVWPDTRVTLRRSTAKVRHGGYVTLSGAVRPAYPGQKVTVERWTSLGWRRLATATLSSSSSYSVRVRLTSAGTYKLRATIGTQLNSLAGASKTITVTAT